MTGPRKVILKITLQQSCSAGDPGPLGVGSEMIETPVCIPPALGGTKVPIHPHDPGGWMPTFVRWGGAPSWFREVSGGWVGLEKTMGWPIPRSAAPGAQEGRWVPKTNSGRNAPNVAGGWRVKTGHAPLL